MKNIKNQNENEMQEIRYRSYLIETSLVVVAAEGGMESRAIDMNGITRCKLAIISESAICKNKFGPTRPVNRFQIVIHQNAMLLFFCLYHIFERIFISFLCFILMNASMSSQLKKFLQIYELFAQDPTVSKEFPMLASPRLYLDIFFQNYA